MEGSFGSKCYVSSSSEDMEITNFMVMYSKGVEIFMGGKKMSASRKNSRKRSGLRRDSASGDHEYMSAQFSIPNSLHFVTEVAESGTLR